MAAPHQRIEFKLPGAPELDEAALSVMEEERKKHAAR